MFDSVRITIAEFDLCKLNWNLIKKKNISKSKSVIIINYKNCELQIFLSSGYILLITNAHTILNKSNICVSDLKEFERRIKAILDEIILDGKYSISVNRLDFHIDVFEQDDMKFKIFMKLLIKHCDNFLYCKSKGKYATSMHLSTKNSGSRNINIYDKYEEQKAKNVTGAELEKWKNCIRIELQYKKMYFKNQYKKYGVIPILENYWNIECFNSMYIDIFDKYFYSPSPYYKLCIAKNIVNNSNLTFTLKKNINKFLGVVNIVGMENIKKYYNRLTINKFCRILIEELNICPITLNDSEKINGLDNLFELAKQNIIKNGYFN